MGRNEPTKGMKRSLSATAVIAVALTSALGAVSASASQWDEIVAAANTEGEVEVHGGPGKVYEEVLTEGFRRAYPQIKIIFSGLSGRDAIPQIMREREAGIYNWDVYVGGTSSILQSLKPIGAFAPLRPALVLPEVLDDKAWFGGLDSGWIDKDRTYILGFEATVTPVMYVNWDFVAHDDLKTYDDLLKPQFAGKIVWDDPRLPGEGVATAQKLFLNFGADFLRRLFAGQKIVYITNTRQHAEWVVNGEYPIGIGTSVDEIESFQAQGLGKKIAPFDASLPHPTVEYGYGTVSLLDRAPHPNAAKVYINWLMSKAAQTDWGKTGHNSRRLDVPHVVPEQFPVAGVTYIASQSEANLSSREAASALAKQFIPAQP